MHARRSLCGIAVNFVRCCPFYYSMISHGWQAVHSHKKDVQFRKTTRLFQETSYKAGFCVPLISAFQQPSRHQTATGCDHAEHDHILPQRSRHRTKPHRSQQRYQNCQQSDCRHHPADPLSVQEEQQTDADQQCTSIRPVASEVFMPKPPTGCPTRRTPQRSSAPRRCLLPAVPAR